MVGTVTRGPCALRSRTYSRIRCERPHVHTAGRMHCCKNRFDFRFRRPQFEFTQPVQNESLPKDARIRKPAPLGISQTHRKKTLPPNSSRSRRSRIRATCRASAPTEPARPSKNLSKSRGHEAPRGDPSSKRDAATLPFFSTFALATAHAPIMKWPPRRFAFDPAWSNPSRKIFATTSGNFAPRRSSPPRCHQKTTARNGCLL